MYRNNSVTRRLAVAAFDAVKGHLKLIEDNTYAVYLPHVSLGNWVVLVKRYATSGQKAWGVQGTDLRCPSATEAAAMWALAQSFISLPAGEHEEGFPSLTVTAFRAVANDVISVTQDRVEPLTADELVAVRQAAEAVIAATETEWHRRQQG